VGTIAAMAATMGLGVSACTVGTECQRPPIALEAFHSPVAVAARSPGSPAPPLDAWWIGFNDLQFVRQMWSDVRRWFATGRSTTIGRCG
jgi:hypothetical protein